MEKTPLMQILDILSVMLPVVFFPVFLFACAWKQDKELRELIDKYR